MEISKPNEKLDPADYVYRSENFQRAGTRFCYPAGQRSHYDRIIRHALVYDGSGSDQYSPMLPSMPTP